MTTVDTPEVVARRRAPEARARRRTSAPRAVLHVAIALAIALAAWSFFSHRNPKLVPSISETWTAAVDLYQSGAMRQDVTASVTRVLLGFAIGSALGIVIGFVMGWYRTVHGIVDPWIQFLRMIPPLALLPVVIVYLGIGEEAKVAVIAFSVLLVMVIAAYEGVRAAPPILVKAARAMGANDWQLLWTVVLPGSVPYVLVGLRLGLAAGWTTVVAAELIAASAGLGYRVQISGTEFDMATAYVAIFLIGVLGLTMDVILRAVERAVTPWQDRVRT